MRIEEHYENFMSQPDVEQYVELYCSNAIKGTELNIAILVSFLSSVPFMTIINPAPFIVK